MKMIFHRLKQIKWGALVSVCLIASLFFLNIPGIVRADQNGSIEVLIDQDILESDLKIDLNRLSFGLIQVGEVLDGTFVYKDEFSKFEQEHLSLSEIDSAAVLLKTAVDLLDYTNQNHIPVDFEKKMNSSGKAIFDSLGQGVYLLYCLDRPENCIILPALCMLPCLNQTTSQMDLNIQISPKISRLPELVIHKIDSKTKKQIQDGFVFELKDADDQQMIQRQEGANYQASFMIPFGQSCIEEIKAPDGYQKSDQKIELNLGYHGLSINGILQEKQAEYFIEFENEPEDVIDTSNNVHSSTDNRVIFWIILGFVSILYLMIFAMQKKHSKNSID